MHDIKSNIKLAEHIAAGSKGVGNADGAAVDLSGFSNISFLLSCGTAGGTIDAKVQHSEDGTTFVDSAVADTGEPVAIAQKNAAFSDSIHITKPTHRYYRVRVTIGTGASVVAAMVAFGGARHLPVTQA